jgi:pimeloyl-ACP methyl ester carboxylesterase
MIRECQRVACDCALGIVVVATMIFGICGAFETTAQAETWMVRHSADTSSGRISHLEQGKGPVAFVHGVLLNGYLWRHQLAELSDVRRCMAVDLLAHGDTRIAPDRDVSVTANAKMLREFLDALKIDQVDLVGNDSGSGIAQIFAALYPERVRSLTLTDGDTHDKRPPEAFNPFLAMAAAGGLPGTLKAMIVDKNVYRSRQALGPAYEHPGFVSDDTIEQYLCPLARNEQRTRDFQRFLAAFDNKHKLAIEDRLKSLKAPTLIVWGTDDVYFDVKWGQSLSAIIPGTGRYFEFKGARIFFPEERWQDFDKELRLHWQSVDQAGNAKLSTMQTSAAVIGQWNEIGRKLIAIAEDLPENKYEYKPNVQSRSFIQQLVHAAGSMYYFTDVAHVKQPRYGDVAPRSEWVTKDDVVAFVNRCVKDGADLLASKGDAGLNEGVNDGSPHLVRLVGLAYRVIEHSGEHYSQLVAYMQLFCVSRFCFSKSLKILTAGSMPVMAYLGHADLGWVAEEKGMAEKACAACDCKRSATIPGGTIPAQP